MAKFLLHLGCHGQPGILEQMAFYVVIIVQTVEEPLSIWMLYTLISLMDINKVLENLFVTCDRALACVFVSTVLGHNTMLLSEGIYFFIFLSL